MNYRHIYHAGNFCDVFKHVVLVGLIQALLRKDKPFCYIDTHAGTGFYDFFSSEAQKSQEFQEGILPVLKQQTNRPALVEDYLSIVKSFNSNPTKLQYYPGSPCIAHSLLRENDRMVLTELHTSDYEKLKQQFLRDKQVGVHHHDAYQALKAFLPPLERRGLVLMDPSFEQPDEFKQVIHTLKQAFMRWSTGIYAIWYPVKNQHARKQFLNALRKSTAEEILLVELNIYPTDVSDRLNGSGMAIINPPWQLDKTLKAVLPWLWSVLSPKQLGGYEVKWL